jgi:biopolymer transport protein ExbB
MIPLGIISLAMWGLIIERVVTFSSLSRHDISTYKAVQILAGEEIQLWSEGLRVQLLQNFLKERSGDPEIDRRVLRLVTERMRRGLRKYLAVIAVLASIAPLMGLLGTVLGMIETFDVISLFGTGNAKAMAGGISVALVTTQTGLLVAIPGLILSGLLLRRSQRLETRLDELTTILDRVVRNPLAWEGAGV